MVNTAYHYLDLAPKGVTRTASLLPGRGCGIVTSIKPAPEARVGRLGRIGGVVSSFGTVLCAVLLPKCPLCLAALLGAIGLGASGASLVAPLVRPAAMVLAAAGFLLLAWSASRSIAARLGAARAGERCCSFSRHKAGADHAPGGLRFERD
jgi:hypothetical protein